MTKPRFRKDPAPPAVPAVPAVVPILAIAVLLPAVAALAITSVIAPVDLAAAAAYASAGEGGGVFSDVGESHWAYSAVGRLAGLGVLEGVGEGRFEPDRPITRAEFVTALLRARGFSTTAQAAVDPAFGGPGYGRGSHLFHDVPAEAWYAAPVALAYRLAIAEGVTPDRFDPGRPVTRQEAAAFAVRAAGWTARARAVSPATAAGALKARFSDGGAVSSWARPLVTTAVEEDLIEGLPGGNFAPAATTTRAQAAVILDRLREGAPPPGEAMAASAGGPVVPASGVLRMTATAYGPHETNSGPWDNSLCYLGLPTREGIVAVDPAVVALGTHLYIEGYGYAVAADIGGAVKGHWVDLFLNVSNDALKQFGLRTLTVLIVD